MKNARSFVGRNAFAMLFAVATLFNSIALLAENWSGFRGPNNGSHAGSWNGYLKTNYTAYEKPEPAFSFNLVPENENQIYGYPLNYSNGTASEDGRYFYFAVEKSENTVWIAAFDVILGMHAWNFEALSYNAFDSASSPVYSKGYIYWVGSDGTNTKVYKIYAGETPSTENGGWVTEISSKVVVNCSPLVADGKVFFSTYSDWGAYNSVHYALNDADGSIAWTNNTAGGYGTGIMAYDSANKLLFQSTYIGGKENISALRPSDGTVLWTSSFDFSNMLMQTGIVFKNGYIYVQDYSFVGGGKIYKINATDGSLEWSAETAESGNGCPAVDDDGNVFVSGGWMGSGSTRAFDKDKNILWTTDKAGGWMNSPSCVKGEDAKKYVLIGDQSASDKLYLLDALTGEIKLAFLGSGPVVFGSRYFASPTPSMLIYMYPFGLPETSPGMITNLYMPNTNTKRPKISSDKRNAKLFYYDCNRYVFSFLKPKEMPAGWYDFAVNGKNISKLNIITPSVLQAYFDTSDNTLVNLKGYFMGDKTPEVFVYPSGTTSNQKEKKCKVRQYFLNPATGEAYLQFVFPSDKDAGYYDIIVSTVSGPATLYKFKK